MQTTCLGCRNLWFREDGANRTQISQASQDPHLSFLNRAEETPFSPFLHHFNVTSSLLDIQIMMSCLFPSASTACPNFSDIESNDYPFVTDDRIRSNGRAAWPHEGGRRAFLSFEPPTAHEPMQAAPNESPLQLSAAVSYSHY